MYKRPVGPAGRMNLRLLLIIGCLFLCFYRLALLAQNERPAEKNPLAGDPEAVAAGNKEAALAALRESQRVIDRVVAKGILHRNAGGRHKSRLAHAVKGLK